MKKWIAVMILAVLMLQIVGCSQPGSSSAAPAPSGSSAGSAESAAAPADSEKVYSEHEVVSYAVYGDEFTDINSDDFAKMWGEKFNIEWDLISMSADTWDEKIRIWTNAQDLPDVAQWEYKHADAAGFVDQGLVKKLPDDWKSRWPNLAAAYENTVLGPLLDEQYGGTYFLPRPIFANNKPTETMVTHEGIYMRKDWLKAVDAEIKVSYTIDELMEIARKIKEQDPGQVGDGLVPIGNNVTNLPYVFVYSLSSHSKQGETFYKGEDGQYRWGPADEDTLTALEYYQQAYEEGLIDPEFFSSGKNYQDVFYTEASSAMCQAPGMAQVALRFSNNFKTNFDIDTDQWLHFAFVTDNEGRYHGVEATNYWGVLMFSPDIDDERLERVLDVLDYSTTDQGQTEIRMGIEGVDWERDANGGLVSLMPEGTTLFDKYYCIRPFYHNLYITSDDFGLVNPAYPQVFRDMSRNQYEAKEAAMTPETFYPIDWDANFYDSDAMRRCSFNLAEEYAALVVAPGDMETKWNNWVAEKMQLVQPVLDELNAKF